MWCALALILLLCLFGALRLEFVEDISSFLPSNKQNERVNYAYEHLGGDNKILVYVGMADSTAEPDVTLLTQAADLFVESLTAQDTARHVKEIRYTVDDAQIAEITDFILQNLPYFLTEEDYARMDTLVSYAHIDRQLGADKLLLSTPVPLMRSVVQHDPLFFSSSVLQSLNAFKLDESYHTEEGYIFDKEGREAVIIVNSKYPMSETRNNAELIKNIDQTANKVVKDMDSGVRIHSFGASQVSLTNARQIKRDSFTAIALAMVLILALLLYYYRNIRSIVLIFVSTLFGGAFALGAIVLFKNPVSVIAIGVASIIIGIAINYPIHVLSHFKRTDDKEQIIKDIVTPLLIGNITTVGAFVSLLFISSPAMKDLGLFSALLLVGTILFVLIFLPHLMGKHFQGRERGLAFRHVAEFQPEKVKGLFWGIVALTVMFAFFSKRTSFDTDMHHINYMTKEQQTEFARLRAAADTSVNTVYCIAEAETLDGALEQNEKVQDHIQKLMRQTDGFRTYTKSISGIGTFLPSKACQKQRLSRWNQFWNIHQKQFFADLDKAAAANGFSVEAFQPCKDIISGEFSIQDPDYFDVIHDNLAESYIAEEKGRVMVYNMLKIDKKHAEDFESEFNDSSSEHFFAFTESSIATRLVDALSQDFDHVLYICGIIVFAFLLFTFGSLELSLMAFLPLFTAWIWILGIMGISGIRFNIVNIILATFIFGMGDDYSIFVTEGLIYEYKYGRKMLSQFKNSIVLSASIMFVGIGMLIFAKHPAMKSLAEVTIVGMFSVVLMAYLLPPIIFKWLTTRKGELRKRPITLRHLLRTMLVPAYFIAWFIVITVAGFLWLRLGKNNAEHKLKYHRLMQRIMRVTAKVMPGTSYTLMNPENEDFQKPAVIICNHQSHLDLIYLLALSPKIIALTNDWAWNTPIYRNIVRQADFLPVSNGMENNYDKIEAMVKKGYSVLVFPEGTRSMDLNILRFHQGAFQLADRLGLDVLPVVCHGIGNLLAKHEKLLSASHVTVSIKPRITPDDNRFRKGHSSLETTRLFRHYYQAEYARLRESCETPDYLKSIVRSNYIYKGQDVEAEYLRKTWQVNFLIEEIESVPRSSRVLYKNCGKGVLSLFAALYRKDLTFIAYDSEQDSIDVAAHCQSVPSNLTYTAECPDESCFDFVFDEKEL